MRASERASEREAERADAASENSLYALLHYHFCLPPLRSRGLARPLSYLTASPPGPSTLRCAQSSLARPNTCLRSLARSRASELDLKNSGMNYAGELDGEVLHEPPDLYYVP